jgi:hypothetical protein
MQFYNNNVAALLISRLEWGVLKAVFVAAHHLLVFFLYIFKHCNAHTASCCCARKPAGKHCLPVPSETAPAITCTRCIGGCLTGPDAMLHTSPFIVCCASCCQFAAGVLPNTRLEVSADVPAALTDVESEGPTCSFLCS